MESSPWSNCHGDIRRTRTTGSSGGGSGSGSSGPPLRSTNPSPPSPVPSSQPFFRPMEPRVFDDDDPVDRTPRPLRDDQHRGASADGGAVALTTHCECSALARDASADDFAVLVHARAPGMAGAVGAAAPARAPLDLVTVLDVSASMVGAKLELLYADEERRFLLFLHVPRARHADDDDTHLVRVACAYRDTATGRSKNVAGEEDAKVRRPWGPVTSARSVEVERERVRVEATDGIAAARAAAERGAHAEAVEILRHRQRSVTRSAAARAGDSTCLALSRELREMRARVASRQRYELSGRAYVLAGLSSHAQQRATSRQMVSGGVAEATRSGESAEERSVALATAGLTTSYMTPAMLDMLGRSRRSRELLQQRQQQTKERRRTF